MDLYTFLVIVHLIGAVLGVGGATFIEIFINKALADGTVDPTESSFLKTTYRVVRIGLILSLLSGFGFLLMYKLTGQNFKLYNPILWAKMTMIVIIAVNAVLLEMRKINLFWGSAFSFVSWYSVLIISPFLSGAPKFSYLEVVFGYIVAVLVGAVVLDIIRKKIHQKPNTNV